MPFAAYTTAETPNAFQWAKQPPKLPLLVDDLDPMFSWAHKSVPKVGSLGD